MQVPQNVLTITRFLIIYDPFELENVIQRALILQTGDFIELGDLQLEVGVVTKDSVSSQPESAAKLGDGVKNHEFQLILEALEKFGITDEEELS